MTVSWVAVKLQALHDQCRKTVELLCFFTVNLLFDSHVYFVSQKLFIKSTNCFTTFIYCPHNVAMILVHYGTIRIKTNVNIEDIYFEPTFKIKISAILKSALKTKLNTRNYDSRSSHILSGKNIDFFNWKEKRKWKYKIIIHLGKCTTHQLIKITHLR